MNSVKLVSHHSSNCDDGHHWEPYESSGPNLDSLWCLYCEVERKATPLERHLYSEGYHDGDYDRRRTWQPCLPGFGVGAAA